MLAGKIIFTRFSAVGLNGVGRGHLVGRSSAAQPCDASEPTTEKFRNQLSTNSHWCHWRHFNGFPLRRYHGPPYSSADWLTLILLNNLNQSLSPMSTPGKPSFGQRPIGTYLHHSTMSSPLKWRHQHHLHFRPWKKYSWKIISWKGCCLVGYHY